MTATLTPNLTAAALAAGELHGRLAKQAGRHLAAATATLRPELAAGHQTIAAHLAAEAGAALLEFRHLHAAATADRGQNPPYPPGPGPGPGPTGPGPAGPSPTGPGRSR